MNNKNRKKIQPALAGGLRDYLPEEQVARQEMLDKIRVVFERFGFAPLDTPALEKEEILTGSDKEFKKQIFKIKSSEKLALRFDLTVPLARVVSSHFELGRPFKRYQIGKVWRGESQQFGRYREFTQCDADIVGTSNLMADAEVIALVYETLNALGISDFAIKIGDRGTLNEIVMGAGVPAKKIGDIVRLIDKVDKLGWAGVEKEAGAMGLISEFKKIKESLNKSDKTLVRELMDKIGGHLRSLGVPADKYKIDLSIARGLGYYTGIVFETVLNDFPEIGSVCSGGRYDGLVERFSASPVPAVGMSVGIDRLFAALEKLGKVKKTSKIANVLVLNFSKSTENRAQEIAAKLRAADIKTEIYLGKEETFKGQLAYAVKNEYPVVVIIGPKEIQSGKIQIKNMAAKIQTEAVSANLVAEVKSILKK